MYNLIINTKENLKPQGIIITGSSGYLGRNLIKQLDKDSIMFLNRNSFNSKNPIYFDIKNQEFPNIKKKFDKFVLIHLATFYSSDNKHYEKIKQANIEFSRKVLDITSQLNLTKVIYTNTMFNYFSDYETQNLYYTKSKNEFSRYLWEESKLKNFMVDEIYLENTFGGDDNRGKIIESIKHSVSNNEKSPVIFKNKYVNLIYFEDVLQRFKKSLNSDVSGKSSFVYDKSVNLESIYRFLLNYQKTKEIDKEILKFKNNCYVNPYPKISRYNIDLSKIDDELINYLDSKS